MEETFYEQTPPQKDLYYCWGMRKENGYLLMPDQSPRVMHWLKHEIEFNKGDCVLVGFPTSGIFWAQEVLWHMNHLDQIGKEKEDQVGVRIPFLEHMQYGREPADVIRSYSSPHTFKFHLSAQYLARHIEKGKVKVIVWLMDPRAVMANYYNMYNFKASRYINFPVVDWNTFYELVRRDQLFEGNWFENTLSYLKYKDHPNVLIMKYEDAAKDHEGTVRRLAAFMEKDLSEEDIKRLVGCEPFDPPTNWQDKFSKEELEEFNQMYREKMKGSELENDYV